MAEVIKYFSYAVNHNVLFDRGYDTRPDGSKKEKPPLVISFRNHHYKTDDPEEQQLIEAHPLFNKKFWRVNKDHKVAPPTKYADGVQTTGNDVDTATGLSKSEAAALKRAQAKIDAGDEENLTELEQAVWEIHGKKNNSQ